MCGAVAGTPGPELCGDGIDNNCNGLIDEGFSDVGKACTSGTGACKSTGTYACSTDKLSVVCNAPVIAPGAAELCGNGIDDNCNGVVDEGFTNVGTVCSAGVGACMRTGNIVCSTDLLSEMCDVTPGTPGPELCGDGIDNNCNGQVDEGFTDVGMPCTVGVGACMAMGKMICSGDKLSTVCSATPGTPGPELCGDGIDNNCNGEIDEGFASVGQPCTSGVGACAATGAYECSTDKLSVVCSAVGGTPSPDICDGIDNDCNPATPDGSQDPNLGKPCGASPSDACPTGTYIGCSSAGKLLCSDTTIQNTSNDINNCGSCGHVCSNAHGGTSCVNGSCVPTCAPGFFDCDGNPGDGCETIENLGGDVCGEPTYLGALSGDTTDSGDSEFVDENGHDVVTATGSTSTSDWYQVLVEEDDYPFGGYLSAQAYLNVPAGVNYELFTYCYNCGGVEQGPTDTRSSTFQQTALYRRDYTDGNDDLYWFIEVRYTGGNACGAYELYINSDYAVDNTTCFWTPRPGQA